MKMSKEIQKKIKKIRDALKDREFFLSPVYHAAMLKLIKELAQKDNVGLIMDYDESPNGKIACTNGNGIYINAGNRITCRLSGREEKVESLEGFGAHECGHILYTDFNRRTIYLNGFEKGLIYPWPPIVKMAAEKRAWKAMKAFIKKKDPVAVTVISDTASYITNVLEDVFIEGEMCEDYPGGVSTAIQKNAARAIAAIPSEEKRKEANSEGLPVMMDMIFRYARAGETKEEAACSMRYTACLDTCKETIDEAVQSQDKDIRYTACNSLMLKIWGYLKKEIEEVRTELKEEIRTLSDEELVEKLRLYLSEKNRWSVLSEAAANISEAELPEGWDGSQDGAAEKEKSNSKNSRKSGSLDRFREEQADIQEGKEPERSQNLWDLKGDTNSMSNEIAREKYKKDTENQLAEELKKEVKKLPLDRIHDECKFEIHRSAVVSDETRQKYAEIALEIKKITRSLQQMMEDILKRQDDGTLTGLYMGKRLSKAGLYRRDGKCFEKPLVPGEELSIALAILVDDSGSMEGDRLYDSKKACISIYKFCRALSIPVMVYGHTTHYVNDLEHEVVDIFACADCDSVDGEDYLRIMELESLGCNRDGAALCFTGERLAARPEKIKILLSLSDGLPWARNYRGDVAKKDIQNVKEKLKKKGVTVFAAAIGEDRKQIEDIYEDGYLSISDLKAMPKKFASLLTRYI